MGIQAGIPLFYLQHLPFGNFRFRDNFADSEKYWAWRLFLGEISEVGKAGVEENGYYELSVLGTKDGRWDTDDNEAPRLFIGSLGCPFEVRTKLTAFSDLEDNCAGLFLAKSPTMFGTNLHYGIVRKHTAATDGLAVVKDAQTLASVVTPISKTLPVWFRMRVGCGAHQAYTVYFDYSHDGVNWTNLYAQDTGWAYLNLGSPGVGIFVNNFSSFTAVSGRFDFFEMKPKTIN